MTLDAEKIREDVRAMWKMGFFDDIEVEGETAQGAAASSPSSVKEKPAIRRSTSRATTRSALSKINEVLDLELDAILDLAKVKKNREKIADLYVQKGFYMATVDYEVKRDTEAEVDVWFHVGENAKVEVRA